MAVMARERWTDERIDKAFDRVDADIRELRVEIWRGFDQIEKRLDKIDKRFEQVDKRFEQVDKRFERVDDKFDAMQREMNTRFDSLQRTMFIGFVTLFASIAASVIGGIFAALALA